MADLPLAQRAHDAWDDAAYTSAIPDFKGAPEVMFHAAGGWGNPDPAWQREHRGWEPERSARETKGHPVHLASWDYWVPKAQLRHEARASRLKRVIRYAMFAALYPLAFTAVITIASLTIFFFIAFGVLFFGAPIALLGSITLFLAVSLMLATQDFAYLTAVHRGVRGTRLFWWTLTPALVLDLLITFGVSVATFSIINLNSELEWLAAFSASVAMLSLIVTVPVLVTYAIKELRLKES